MIYEHVNGWWDGKNAVVRAYRTPLDYQYIIIGIAGGVGAVPDISTEKWKWLKNIVRIDRV